MQQFCDGSVDCKLHVHCTFLVLLMRHQFLSLVRRTKTEERTRQAYLPGTGATVIMKAVPPE